MGRWALDAAGGNLRGWSDLACAFWGGVRAVRWLVMSSHWLEDLGERV